MQHHVIIWNIDKSGLLFHQDVWTNGQCDQCGLTSSSLWEGFCAISRQKLSDSTEARARQKNENLEIRFYSAQQIWVSWRIGKTPRRWYWVHNLSQTHVCGSFFYFVPTEKTPLPNIQRVLSEMFIAIQPAKTVKSELAEIKLSV